MSYRFVITIPDKYGPELPTIIGHIQGDLSVDAPEATYEITQETP